ncbi:unnamed protein product [Urochloa humidicola]
MDAAPPRRRPRLPLPGTAADVLDSLPPELLNAILSRLPLRDAVRTSVLARAWRRRWLSVPSLKFLWDGSADPGAITGVLRRYSLPVREFRHSAIGKASFRHSDRWLRLLVLKGVQILRLEFRTSRLVYHTLHTSIFSCRELTVLDLQGCDVPATPPGFEGLPNLTVLRLSSVGFAEGVRDLQLLIATSPLLEGLYISLLRVYSDDENDQWVIQAPKLRWFYISDAFYCGWKIGDIPSLEQACIRCPFDHDFVKHMARLSRARDLQLLIQVDDGNTLEGLSCPFNDLKSLTLDTSLNLLSSVLSVFCLLRNAPKLEGLYIEVNDIYSEHDEVDMNFLNAQWTSDFLSILRHVHVVGMTCTLSEMNFIKFILSKARRLEKFCIDEDCSKSKEAVVTELLKYRRASPRAKVFFTRVSDD